MSTAALTTHPPSPPGHWLFGHLLSFRNDVLGNLVRWSELGPVVQLRLLNKPAFLINEPALIEYPLVSNHNNYIKNQVFWRHVPLVGNGLLTSEGDFWRRQRRLSAPAFHAPRIAEYGQVMVDYTLREMRGWRDGDTRDVHRDTMALTSKIVAKTLFDDDHVEGELGEVGVVIYFSAWALHRNPRHFPEPDRFKPERWDNELERRLPRFAYMPFGGGPRTCIGDRFALMEAVLLLAALVQRFRFEYLGTEPPTPYPSITLRPMQGVPMRLSTRAT